MGTAVGLRSAGRTWTLGSPGTYLGITAITWGMVLWMEVGAWTYHYSDQGDYTWEQARNYCQTFFTDLVAIQNQQEIEYLNKSLPYHGRYYWIGIRKLGGIWTWVGTRKALTKEAENWAVGEPNNRRSNQDCVEIYIQRPQQSGKWNDEPCNRKKKALCYKASCQPFSCSQHGECVETIGSYLCKCYPGFHGPECMDAVQCAKLEPKGVPMNCSHPYRDFGYNSICEFRCHEGFERRGPGMLQCLPSQEWSANIPTCTAITCPVLSAPDQGELNCSHLHGDFTFGSTCAFSCQKGFALMGSDSRKCTATGTWTGDAPRCEAVKCSALTTPKMGQAACSHLHGDFTFGSTCAFSCQTGFVLMGPESRECTATGSWTGDATRCEAISCPVLSAPDQGEMHCSHLHGNFTYGSTCSFSCQTGFALVGLQSCECTAMGTWTGDTPHCEAITCPVLSAPDHGELNCSHLHGNFTFGSVCAFSCQKGFALMGSDSRKCTATGTWTGDAPRCEAIKCSALTTPKMGQAACSHVHGDFTFGSTCAFSCQTGFVLMGPESRECTATGTWTGDPTHCKVTWEHRAPSPMQHMMPICEVRAACPRLEPSMSPGAAGPAGAAAGAQRNSMPVVVAWTSAAPGHCHNAARAAFPLPGRGAASSAGSWRPARGQEPRSGGSLPLSPWTFSHWEFGHSPVAASLMLPPKSLCQQGLNKHLSLTN
ncbi:E-selectin-like isoform 8-T14 [Sylvia borin]